MTIRKYRPENCTEMAKLFYDTVHTVNAADYTEPQLNAWATGEVDLAKWNASFQIHNTVITEIDGAIVASGIWMKPAISTAGMSIKTISAKASPQQSAMCWKPNAQ